MLEKKSIEYEKAVLIGVMNKDQNEEKVNEYLDELEHCVYMLPNRLAARVGHCEYQTVRCFDEFAC